MKSRKFTIHGILVYCKRISKTPFIIATFAGKRAKFEVYGKEVTLIEGDVPPLILEGKGGLLDNIATWFANNLERPIQTCI